MSESLMNAEELEILYFYREGMSVKEISEATGHSIYRLKKLLANEPAIQPAGYIWRSLFGKIPDCSVKGV